MFVHFWLLFRTPVILAIVFVISRSSNSSSMFSSDACSRIAASRSLAILSSGNADASARHQVSSPHLCQPTSSGILEEGAWLCALEVKSALEEALDALDVSVKIHLGILVLH